MSTPSLAERDRRLPLGRAGRGSAPIPGARVEIIACFTGGGKSSNFSICHCSFVICPCSLL